MPRAAMRAQRANRARAHARKRKPAPEAPAACAGGLNDARTVPHCFFATHPGPFVSPTGQYSTRLTDRKSHLARFAALNARIERLRLGVGAAFLVIAWLCLGPP